MGVEKSHPEDICANNQEQVEQVKVLRLPAGKILAVSLQIKTSHGVWKLQNSTINFCLYHYCYTSHVVKEDVQGDIIIKA